MRTERTARTIGELSGLIASGEVSPVGLVEAALDAIDRYDGDLRAFIDVYRDQAMADAFDRR